MGKYILKRLLWLIPVMVGVITIVFAITVFMPGDPAAALLDKNATQEQIDEVHTRLGLDKPVLERWGNYVVGVFTKFDFGTSYTTMQPVRNEVLAKLPYTLILAVTSTLFAFLIGVPLGIWGALKQYTAIDAAILFLSVLFVSMPSFWLAMMLIDKFAVQMNILPAFGVSDAKGWILPIVVCTIGSMAGNIRITRSSMLEVMQQDYIRTARAKGVAERMVILKHGLRNAILPVVTYLGTLIANLLTGSFIVERLFAIPGLGKYFVDSITARDYNIIMGVTIFLGVFVVTCNLIVDVVYGIIDPRVKLDE